MISHGEKCTHCRGNMSAPKPVTEGPRTGQTRTFCIKCGHIQYHLPPGATPLPRKPPVHSQSSGEEAISESEPSALPAEEAAEE